MNCCVCLALALLAVAPHGQVALLASEEGDQQVRLLDLDTRGVRNLGSGGRDGAPVWSPDGTHVAFASAANGARFIHVVAVDAQASAVLAGTYAWNGHPRWAADGGAIAYECAANEGDLPKLAVRNGEAGHLHEAREEIWAGGREGFLRPVWLPSLDLRLFLDPERELAVKGVDMGQLWEEAEASGALLALGVTPAGGHVSTEIYVVTETQVMPLLLEMIVAGSDRFVEWGCSVDRKGRQVAYESNDGGDREIYMLGSRGVVNLSNHREADWNPVWSPRKDWLAFESFRGGRRGVYVVYPKTASVRAIAAGEGFDARTPTWSPDGEWLAYIVDEDERSVLTVRAFDGKEPAILFPLPAAAAAPAWRPEVKP